MLFSLAGKGAAGDPRLVAIYYDGPSTPQGEGYVGAYHVLNLLGHFDLNGEILSIKSYRPGQLLGFRAAFFIGTRLDTKLPPAFLADVEKSTKPFCWIWRHIGSLVNSPARRKKFGFSYVESRDDLELQIVYKGVTLAKEEPDLDVVSVNDPSVEVLATAVTQDGVSRPYALRRGQFWYFADSVFSYMQDGGRYLVFCDLLHDILGIHHPSQALALVRIEDVSADVDPSDLRQIADLLANRKVPFQFGVIPIFRSPPTPGEIRISDRTSLVDAIHYMIQRGGTPVLHGVTHQYEGQSGDDYEFWDGRRNRAIRADSAETVAARLEHGLAECFASGIYPLAFETPHYAASEVDYRAMAKIFGLFYERTMLLPDVETIQGAPYPLKDRFGRWVIPENLGYMPQDSPDPKVLIERARKLRVVRDAVASFYFHTFLKRALLAEVVRGVSDAGYQFVSLRRFGGSVNCEGRYAVRTSSGTIAVSTRNDYWRLRIFGADGRLIRERFSRSRSTGPAEVAVQVPTGGWAALDCVRDLPQQAGHWDWTSAFKRWFDRQTPGSRHPFGSKNTLTSSGVVWLLGIDKADPPAANNQESYRAVLEGLGFRVKSVHLKNFNSFPEDKSTILVIPESAGAKLSLAEQQAVLRYLSSGGRIVADGKQPWLSLIGLHFTGHRIQVSDVADELYPEMQLHWQPAVQLERFKAPENAQLFMTDPQSSQPLALALNYANGRCLYLAAPFDPHTRYGVSRYPYFAQYLFQAFEMSSRLRAPRVEAYFDPSYREGVGSDRLAAAWRESGIRTVYAAAWQFYRKGNYDYANLIRSCHRNGIAVYAWLVFPAVTPKMWDEHPEWRERTAAGTDGRVGWRFSMNFQNPDCFREAMGWMRKLLTSYSWDGVNISELNFDADFLDYLRADRFVPMNQQVRADFHKKAGFDPISLFDPKSRFYYKRDRAALEEFLRYREDIVTEWHQRVLTELEPLRRTYKWEIIVTALDSLHSAYVRPALGVNSRRIAALMKDFNFTLQVEDPAEHWIEPPDRYKRFAEAYFQLVPDRQRLMFDVNVMSDRSVEGTFLPSSTATGTELAATIAAAACASGRAAVYSEYTVPHQDWDLISHVLARSVKVNAHRFGWELAGSVPVLFDSGFEQSFYLDERFWPAVSHGGVLVPPGRHYLSVARPWYRFLDEGELRTRLLAITGDLRDLQVNSRGLTVRYSNASRTVILINQQPMQMALDGVSSSLPVEGFGDRWAVLAPAGSHMLEILTTTRTGVVVGLWGWLSAFAVTVFGATATLLMAAIFLHLRWQRKVLQRSRP